MPENWERANVTPVFKKDKEHTGNHRLVSLTSNPGKAMERLILDAISRQREDKKVIRTSQHRFIKGKSWLTNLIAMAQKPFVIFSVLCPVEEGLIEQIWWALNIQPGSAHHVKCHHKPKISNSLLQYSVDLKCMLMRWQQKEHWTQ